MPLSLEEASKRCESYSQNIQDSILIMESFMGSDNSFSFDLPQVITNLESIDTHIEEKNVAARIKVLEEYQRMLVTERKRRSIKQVVKGKMESADFKTNLKRRRQSLRIAQIFKPNVMPAMATAGQVPQPMSAQTPTTSRMPPPMSAQTPTTSRMPPPMSAQTPTTSRMPPLMWSQVPTTSRMPPPMLEQVPASSQMLSQEPIVQDELMLEL